MDEQFLIHMYNVGVGDCIYVRVPDQENGQRVHRHIVIDCGTIRPDSARGEQMLVNALTHLVEEMLPEAGGGDPRKQLDLLVVTHPHMDHYASFGIPATQDLWRRVKVDRLWLTTLMGGSNALAARARQQVGLGELAVNGMQRADLSPQMNEFVWELFNLSMGDIGQRAQLFLTEGPNGNPVWRDEFPDYVHDNYFRNTPMGLFSDPNIELKVLGPAENMDDEYLNKKLTQALAASATVSGVEILNAETVKWDRALSEEEAGWLTIDNLEFQKLQRRMATMGARLAMAKNEVVNNSSVVLLLDWHGKRLLFPGDAECKFTRNGEYNPNKQNFSWNVMAEFHDEDLMKPLDFLKVGHHGSHNASPFSAHDEDNAANLIFEAIAPKNNPQLHAVASCARHASWPDDIPQKALMEELGQRIVNAREEYDEWLVYRDAQGKKWPQTESGRKAILVAKSVKQPPRTDLEHQMTGGEVLFIPVRFPPN